MQHGEEVGAAQELGAGRLEQQRETRPPAGVSDHAVSSVFCREKQAVTLMRATHLMKTQF